MPEIIKEYSLDMLTPDGVSVLEKTYIILSEGDEPQLIGRPVRTSYVNSFSGRAAVQANLPENFVSGILAVWGIAPSVPEEPDDIDKGATEER